MSNPKSPGSKKGQGTRGKFNVKNFDSLTIKQIREMYRDALSFVKKCDEEFSHITGDIYQKRNSNGSVNNTKSSNTDYDVPMFGGNVVDIKLFDSITDSNGDNMYVDYNIPDTYIPPTDYGVTYSNVPVERNEHKEHKEEIELEDDLTKTIQEELNKFITRQQEVE